ncbi:hypothetical protein SHA53_004473 [Salmonella enterica]|nr:hypothetical protein [Salmonella enterica]
MSLPKIIHRIWIGPPPTIKQLKILISARTRIESRRDIYTRINGDAELWLWTTPANIFRLQREYELTNNIVMHNINAIWSHPSASSLPVTALRSVYERESRGVLHNYAAASDVVRLMLLYCYGGIYLDMDVEFCPGKDKLFEDLAGIGERLGMIIWGGGDDDDTILNSVLASRPRTEALRLCLRYISEQYAHGTKIKDEEMFKKINKVWQLKREYNKNRARMYATMDMSGPRMIRKAVASELRHRISSCKYFYVIDVSGRSYTQRPAPELLRRDSAPDLGQRQEFDVYAEVSPRFAGGVLP